MRKYLFFVFLTLTVSLCAQGGKIVQGGTRIVKTFSESGAKAAAEIGAAGKVLNSAAAVSANSSVNGTNSIERYSKNLDGAQARVKALQEFEDSKYFRKVTIKPHDEKIVRAVNKAQENFNKKLFGTAKPSFTEDYYRRTEAMYEKDLRIEKFLLRLKKEYITFGAERFDYNTILNKDTDVLIAGEKHYSDYSTVMQVRQMLLSLQSSGKLKTLATEFLDTHNIPGIEKFKETLDPLDISFLGKVTLDFDQKNSYLLKGALDLNIVPLEDSRISFKGLSIKHTGETMQPVISAAYDPHYSSKLARTDAGMKYRNEFAVNMLQPFLDEGLSLVYMGAGHTRYDAKIKSVSNILKENGKNVVVVSMIKDLFGFFESWSGEEYAPALIRIPQEYVNFAGADYFLILP